MGTLPSTLRPAKQLRFEHSRSSPFLLVCLLSSPALHLAVVSSMMSAAPPSLLALRAPTLHTRSRGFLSTAPEAPACSHQNAFCRTNYQWPGRIRQSRFQLLSQPPAAPRLALTSRAVLHSLDTCSKGWASWEGNQVRGWLPLRALCHVRS